MKNRIVSFLIFSAIIIIAAILYYSQSAEFPTGLLNAFLLIAMFSSGVSVVLCSLGFILKERVPLDLIWKVFLATMFIFIILEVGLRLKGVNETYEESIGGKYGYNSAYHIPHSSYYMTHPPNVTLSRSQNEFEFSVTTNSLGLVEKAFGLKKKGLRVFTIGDSFTQGIGAHADSTWPRSLEYHLQRNDKAGHLEEVEVLNAGVAGSDIFYEYMLMKDVLLPYQPDLVVFMMNSTDVYEYAFRGGMSRFRPDSTVVYMDHLDLENFYASSFLVRFVLGIASINNVMVSDRKYNKRLAEGEIAIKEVLPQLFESVQQNGVECLFVVNPLRHELIQGNYDFLTDWNGILSQLPPQNTFEFFERTDSLRKEKVIYWPRDGHFNSNGYWEIGDWISQKALPLLLNRSDSLQESDSTYNMDMP